MIVELQTARTLIDGQTLQVGSWIMLTELFMSEAQRAREPAGRGSLELSTDWYY